MSSQTITMSGIPPRVLSREQHLRKYVLSLEPQVRNSLVYLETLSRQLRNQREFNIVYPVGRSLFIHIRSRGRERSLYTAVNPAVDVPGEIVHILETLIAPHLGVHKDFETKEEQEKILREVLDTLVVLDDALEDFEYLVVSRRGTPTAIRMNSYTAEAASYALILDKVYMGVLEPLLRDPYIEDISCDGVGPLFVEHKIFGSCESNIVFREPEDLDRFVLKLSEKIGNQVNYRRPIVDSSLPDGSRINIVYGSDISRRGSNFTIRKFSEKPVSILELISWKTLSSLEAAYLWLLMEYGMSVWFCGETASGKTTALRAASVFLNPKSKIVSIEDTPEIVVPHDNWVREVTRPGEGGGGEITLFELLKAALRQRPNTIIVGEIRGQEASVAFQAIQTGHMVLSTFHAGSVEKLIQRLTGDPINIPKTYIDILNAVVIQSAVRIPETGRVERRFLSINEIVGYDPSSKRFDYIELFSWDSVRDLHEFRGEGNSYLLENKILTMMGLSSRNVRKVYEELSRRARILELMLEKGALSYDEVWNMVKLAYEVGTEKTLERIEGGEKIWLRR